MLVMIVLFFLGFVLDFIEIIFIVIPIVGPVVYAADPAIMPPEWITILIAVNLQTSFITPPFGFALFYLRGVAPKNISTFEVNSNQEKLEKNKKIFNQFKSKLNSNEKLIFEKRMYCNKEDEIKLKEISSLLNISNLNKFKARLDPRLYNGAIFIGLDSPVIKSNGGTDFIGFSN